MLSIQSVGDVPPVSLVSLDNPSYPGAVVTFSATVTGDATIPTGTMTFFDGTTQLGDPIELSGGVAMLSGSDLSTGTHSITAHYSGSGNYVAIVSPPLIQNVGGVPPVPHPTPTVPHL